MFDKTPKAIGIIDFDKGLSNSCAQVLMMLRQIHRHAILLLLDRVVNNRML